MPRLPCCITELTCFLISTVYVIQEFAGCLTLLKEDEHEELTGDAGTGEAAAAGVAFEAKESDGNTEEPAAAVAPVSEEVKVSAGLGSLRFSRISGDAKSLHYDKKNAGDVFMVASQFNCLEMVGPGERHMPHPNSGLYHSGLVIQTVQIVGQRTE